MIIQHMGVLYTYNGHNTNTSSTQAQDLFSRHSIVFSNLPGPAEEMYLCGEKLLGMQAVFPNLLAQVI